MRSLIALISTLAVFLPMIAAECPNACSAHGKCGAYDMCLCYRNWMANDCSERICQFGTAHVDTPKGDLDASGGALSGPDVNVVRHDEVYPFGTTEQYPATMDAQGDILTNSAHEYRECSNKGLCDRSTGQCQCFEGYEGSACQRASCPVNADGMCSGHGTCESIKEIAWRDFKNVYDLWDESATMGCVCDPGYSGSDCSERQCKWGADPLYSDGIPNIRFSNWTYQFYTQTQDSTLTGNYSLVFYDAFGEDWQTAPLDWNATCATVIAALEDLPNNAIPEGTVRCYKGEFTTSGTSPGQSAKEDPIVDDHMFVFSKYTLAFPGNVGKLMQLTINKYLDGTRPTLFSDETTSTLGWHIYPNGFTGENEDFVADLCEDVQVYLNAAGSNGDVATATHYLTFTDGGNQNTGTMAKLLKACLGDSDGNSGDNIEVYNWDTGNEYNPHLIKLIDGTQGSSIAVTDNYGDTEYDPALSKYPITKLCSNTQAKAGQVHGNAWPLVDAYGTLLCAERNPPGFYAVLFYAGPVASGTATPYYEGSSTAVTLSNYWRLYTRSATNYASTTPFYVFTTTGYLQMVNPTASVFTTTAHETNSVKINNHYSNVIHASNNSNAAHGFLGNMDCETSSVGTDGALDCLDKNDYVMVLSTLGSTANAGTGKDLFNSNDMGANPIYPNLYQLKKIARLYPEEGVTSEMLRHELVFDYSMNGDFSWNFGSTVDTDTSAVVYKFYPPTSTGSRYNWAGQCSHRGLCNTKTGLCQCFAGFSEDNCAAVNALSN